MIYNKNTAKPIWKDLKIYQSTDKNKRRYVLSPNPGRDFNKSVPLYKFLLKTHEKDTRIVKNLIFSGDIKVNDVIVKSLKHPLHYYDYLSIKDQVFFVLFTKDYKIHSYFKIPYIKEDLIMPVKRWFLKDNKCVINTYQNKLFTVDISPDLFNTLRELDSVVYYNVKDKTFKVSTLSEKQEFTQIVKLTGKQIYKKFIIINHQFYDGKIKLELSRENLSKNIIVILPKSKFRDIYIPYFL